MGGEQIEKSMEAAKELLAVIARAKRYSETPNYNEMFLDAETIVGHLAYMIGPRMEFEHSYRQQIAHNLEAGDSHAKAEAKAKASKDYMNWRKLEALCELGDQQIMLIKKFKDKLEQEYQRTT